MAAFVKYNVAITDIANGKHANALTANTDVLKCLLSNTAPNVATHAVKADATEIATGNGYAGAVSTSNSASTSSGTISVAGTDITITASGGSIGPFRYVILFNDTQTSPAKPLLGYWDYGSSITLATGESFTIDFGATMFTLS